MSPTATALPGGVGLWGGFLDRMALPDAIAAVGDVEAAGTTAVWLQEYSGVDPFVRAGLYLQATQRLSVALGVATIHARDPHAMVAAAATLHEAFPGRFLLGLGASHRHLVQARGTNYARPLAAMRRYLAGMDADAGTRVLPPRFLGALGPQMTKLAGTATDGVHTYFCPVAHTAATRDALGAHAWIAPTQMVADDEAGPGWRDRARSYLKVCLDMPNYRRNLRRLGFTTADLDTASDHLVDALVADATPASLGARLDAHRHAGADHIVVQFVPPPPAAAVLGRLTGLAQGVTA